MTEVDEDRPGTSKDHLHEMLTLLHISCHVYVVLNLSHDHPQGRRSKRRPHSIKENPLLQSNAPVPLNLAIVSNAKM